MKKLRAWFIRNFYNTCDYYGKPMALFESYHRNNRRDREWVYVGNGKLWIKKLKVPCDHCGSKNTKSGFYIRAYNTMCQQAAGDHGYYCESCSRVSFDRTKEEYNSTKPDWVTKATR